MPVATASAPPFRIAFAGHPIEPAPVALRVDVPVLAGVATEEIFDDARHAGTSGAFTLHRAGAWLLGCARVPVAPDLEAATHAVYAQMLAAARGHHLCRVWNYVPHINAPVSGLEGYRAFCRGRSRAFEAEYGPQFTARLCAASAVGTREPQLSVIFAAAPAAPRHVENPAQIPAYRYPAEHGPRAPSFARATIAEEGRVVFVSGTAAIKGHATVAAGDTAAQIDCTLENLALIWRACGLGDKLGADAGFRRHFKVYLRHAADLPAVTARLGATLLRPHDRVTWLHADICRAALNVEIEATLVRVDA